MFLETIINELDLKVLTKPQDFASITVSSGYCSDLLSCVMTGASPEGVWVTLMAHSNIIAVAALLDLSAVIITEDAQPDRQTLEKADEKDVILLSTRHDNFHTIGRLWDLGVRAQE